MSKQLELNKIIGLGILLVPMMSFAAEGDSSMPASAPATAPATAPAAAANEMPKDEWLSKVKMVVSEPICKGFMDDPSISARLKEQGITFEKCVGLIPAIADSCQKKFYDSLPAMMNQDSASTWGRKIGECIGGDFAVSYLYPKANSSAPAPMESAPTPAPATTSTPATTPAQ